MNLRSLLVANSLAALCCGLVIASGNSPTVTQAPSAGEPFSLASMDLDQSNMIDFGDYCFVLIEWGSRRSIADLNQDGFVDGIDLGMVLANYGAVLASERPDDETNVYEGEPTETEIPVDSAD